MANYEALMQELEGVLEEEQEANIMRQIVEILGDWFQSPFDHTRHIRASSKALTSSDVDRLLIPKKDMESQILPRLNPLEDIKNGVPVMVYGSDGVGRHMSLSRWRPIYGLCGGWKRFVKSQGLQVKHIVTLWLFSTRHPKTNVLRFALTTHPPTY